MVVYVLFWQLRVAADICHILQLKWGTSAPLEQENVSQQPSSFMPEVCQIRSIVPVPPYFPKVHTMLVMSDVEKGQRNTRGVDFSVQGLVDLTHIFRILEVLCSISLITFIPGYFDCSL